MKTKIIAAGAGVVLTTLAAVGAFASQDAVNLLEEESPTVEATETIAATETPTEDATQTPEATETAEPTATATEDASATPDATETADDDQDEDGDDEDEDDVRGIPDDNPSHHPEDGDGICEKGETVVKTTPSGKKVNVPCQAADKEHGKHKGTNSAGGEEDDAEDE